MLVMINFGGVGFCGHTALIILFRYIETNIFYKEQSNRDSIRVALTWEHMNFQLSVKL